MKDVKRTVCGVGYKIVAKTIEPNGSRKFYSVWKNMIYRCYSEENISYERYGGVGVVVSGEWHCYDTFRKDAEMLPGFDERMFYENKLQLDKDGLSGDTKIYSKETCQWVTAVENLGLATFNKYRPHLIKVRVVALSPEDEIFCVINIPMFADKYNLLRSGIHGTIGGHGPKTHRGWCFKRVVDYESVAEIDRKDFIQERHGVIPTKYEVVKDGEVIEVLNNVDEAAVYMRCSVSNINQRTRDGKEYCKYGVILRRELKETDNI